MALTFKDGIQPTIVPAEYGVVLTLYPAFDVATGLTSLDPVEVRRAPDAAGAPGTWETIAQDIGPLPPRGQVFVDTRPPTTAVWWYAHRHVKAGGAIGGTWSASYKASVKPMFPGDQRFAIPAAGTATMINTSSRYSVRAVRSAAQTLLTGLATAINLTASDTWDVGDLHDPGGANPERVVIPAVNYHGVWTAIAKVKWAANGVGYRYIAVQDNLGNGEDVQLGTPSGANYDMQQVVATFINPNPGDYIKLMAAQGSGGNLNVDLAVLTVVHHW